MIRQKIIHYDDQVERDPSKKPVYLAISDFFGNPTMTKIKNIKDEEGDYSLYYCRIASQLGGNNYRYVIAICSGDNRPKGRTSPLPNLEWESFQTCVLQEFINIPVHSYTPIKPHTLSTMDTSMSKKESGVEQTIYSCNSLPLEVTVVHGGNIDSITCPDNADLLQGLQSFQTILNWKYELEIVYKY